MDPLEEEACLFAATYGSEETPIPSTGPLNASGTPVPGLDSTATSPIDVAMKQRTVRQPLNFDAQHSATGGQSAKARREHILASLPRSVHGLRKHTPNKNLFDFDEIEFERYRKGTRPPFTKFTPPRGFRSNPAKSAKIPQI